MFHNEEPGTQAVSEIEELIRQNTSKATFADENSPGTIIMEV